MNFFMCLILLKPFNPINKIEIQVMFIGSLLSF